MASKPIILVVGSTGMLGTKIISALLDKGATEVRAMVRPGSDSKQENRQKIEQMNARGAIIVEGDLMKPETLLPICQGVDVVVSAVGNDRTTWIRGGLIQANDSFEIMFL